MAFLQRIPFCVNCLNINVTIWSNVAQHPVQIMVSEKFNINVKKFLTI